MARSASSTPPAILTAAQWAETEKGRRAFRKQFTLQAINPYGRVDENGEPLGYILGPHSPSTEWLARTQAEFLHTLSDSESYSADSEGICKTRCVELRHLRGIQAQYLVDLTIGLAPLDQPVSEEYQHYAKADAVRQPDFDAALTKNLPALLEICIEVRQLRQAYPPASERSWAAVINQIIKLATNEWIQALESYMGQRQSQAMPRPFAKTREQASRLGWPSTDLRAELGRLYQTAGNRLRATQRASKKMPHEHQKTQYIGAHNVRDAAHCRRSVQRKLGGSSSGRGAGPLRSSAGSWHLSELQFNPAHADRFCCSWIRVSAGELLGGRGRLPRHDVHARRENRSRGAVGGDSILSHDLQRRPNRGPSRLRAYPGTASTGLQLRLAHPHRRDAWPVSRLARANASYHPPRETAVQTESYKAGDGRAGPTQKGQGK
ncbi:hypothetical protein FB451DRAFT_1256895 [Mycena latifolia]|nr:hypothetical protein FB451DRAFT_1256895 [Mycena latifolia]